MRYMEKFFFFQYLHFHHCYALHINYETDKLVGIGSKHSKNYRNIRARVSMNMCIFCW